mgnify:CR=1 FL=1
MLTRYLNAAMARARYEMLEEESGVYGYSPDLQGAWAKAPTLEACREELREVLEEWIALGLSRQEKLPVVYATRCAH